MQIEKAIAKLIKQSISEILPEILQVEFIKLNSKNPRQNTAQEILNISEVCQLTGYARQTIYGMVSKGTIPYIKRSGSKFLRFRRSEILDWMENTPKNS